MISLNMNEILEYNGMSIHKRVIKRGDGKHPKKGD